LQLFPDLEPLLRTPAECVFNRRISLIKQFRQNETIDIQDNPALEGEASNQYNGTESVMRYGKCRNMSAHFGIAIMILFRQFCNLQSYKETRKNKKTRQIFTWSFYF